MQKREARIELGKAVAAAALCILVYRLGGELVDRLVADSFMRDFLAELVFAAAVLAAVLVLKKTHIYRSDPALLKRGWPSAFLLLLAIVYLSLTSLANVMEATATRTQWLCLLGQVFLIGFCEETLFRGLIQRAFHRIFGEDSFGHVLLAVLCSGLIFGLVHLINLLRGASPGAIVMQAGVNVFTGMYYCAVYFRTGKCLWYTIALHALYDLGGLLQSGRLSGRTLVDVLNIGDGSLSVGQAFLGILLWGTVYLLPTLFILRPKKLRPLLTDAAEPTPAE